MRIYRLDDRWIVEAPAKLNLFFEVLEKRSDGFHEIVSVSIPIIGRTLFDTIEFEPVSVNTIAFECVGGMGDVPIDDSNIVVRAIRRLREVSGIELGCRVKLSKRIPSQAGLGGGSSDAVAALLAAKTAWNLADTLLKPIANEIGSDCALFFHNTATLATGRGEIIEPIISRLQTRLHFVLFKPNEGLSTADVFRRCMSFHDNNFRSPDKLIHALKTGDIDSLSLFNRLEEPAFSLLPQLLAFRDEMSKLDFIAVQMSGSGTTLFGICRSEEHAIALENELMIQYSQFGNIYRVNTL